MEKETVQNIRDEVAGLKVRAGVPLNHGRNIVTAYDLKLSSHTQTHTHTYTNTQTHTKKTPQTHTNNL